MSSRNHSVYNFLVIVLPQKQFFTWPQAVAHVQIQARTQQVPCGFLKPFSWVVFSSLLCLRNLSHLSCLVFSALISTCSAQMLDLTGCFFCGCPWSGNRLQLERPGGPGHLVCFPRLRGHSPALPYASVWKQLFHTFVQFLAVCVRWISQSSCFLYSSKSPLVFVKTG